MDENAPSGFVTRGEFDLAKELQRERHGTLLVRLDSMEARVVSQKEHQDMVNAALKDQVTTLGVRVNDGFKDAAIWAKLVSFGVLLLLAINAPGLLKIVKTVLP